LGVVGAVGNPAPPNCDRGEKKGATEGSQSRAPKKDHGENPSGLLKKP